MAIVTSAQFADLLDPVFRDIAVRSYEKGKSRIPDFFTVKESDRATEKYSEITTMGKFATFTDSITFDSPVQGYDVTATHVEYAKGIQIRRAVYDDDQHGVIPQMFEQFGESAFKTHEDHAAELFNSAFSAVSGFFSHTASVALCSDSHTTPVSGVSTTTGFDNAGTSALSPAVLQTILTAFRNFKDDQGDKYESEPTALVVPTDLRPRAEEILKTTTGLDSADNNVNVLNGKFKLIPWYRLTDTNNFFVVDEAQMKRECLWFWRVRLELAKMESFDNITAKSRGYMRYSFLWRGWRWVYGNSVS